MAIQLLLQSASPFNNDPTQGWQDLTGLKTVKLVRSSPSIPASLEVTIIADQTTDAAPDVPGSPPGKRFYPYLNIQLVIRLLPAANDIPLFIGRLDHAELDDGPPRIWRLYARDWLSVLADNNVNNGRWNSAPGVQPVQPGPITPDLARNLPNTFNPGTIYVPAYVGDYATRGGNNGAPPGGEFRKYIIEDLCLNIVGLDSSQLGQPLGLTGVNLTLAPNSKPVVWSAADLGEVSILDAIRDLITADPWCGLTGPSGCPASAVVDTVDLVSANFPNTSGIGGELQIAPYQTGNEFGRIAQYFARGAFGQGLVFVYQSDEVATATAQIISCDFSRSGADIFSRVRSFGRGDATSRQFNPSDGWVGGFGGGETGNPPQNVPAAGIYVPMETIWAPTSGNYKVRRESSSRATTAVGYSGFSETPNVPESSQVLSRDLKDRAFAQMWGAANGLSATMGGTNSGQITLAGPPLTNTPGSGILLQPGFACTVIIPHLGLTSQNGASSRFVMDTISYEWPLDQTTITLSRTSYLDVRKQLRAWLGLTSQANAGHANRATTPWEIVPDGVLQWQHNIGVWGARITVEVAAWDGQTFDVNLAPVPVPPSSITQAPTMAWDAAQGQYTGVYIAQNDANVALIYFGHFIANNANNPYNNGWYIASDAQHTIVRVTVIP